MDSVASVASSSTDNHGSDFVERTGAARADANVIDNRNYAYFLRVDMLDLPTVAGRPIGLLGCTVRLSG